MSKRGGHGGAWKVAYADFVTAMMALFMVLWIVASSQEIKQGIAGYFRSTSLVQQERKAIGTLAPITTMSKTQPEPIPQTPNSQSELGGDPESQEREAADSKGPDVGASGMKWSYRILAVQQHLKETLRHEVATLQKLLARNNQEISDSDEFRFEFMNDGMRIQALDKDQQPLFEMGTATLTPHGEWVLKNIAYEMERFPFRIEVEGHVTKKGSKTPDDLVDPWDLSTRRAIAAQQFLVSKQISESQFYRVAGMADRVPLDPNFPEDAANRRITLTFRLDPNADFDAVKRAFQPPK